MAAFVMGVGLSLAGHTEEPVEGEVDPCPAAGEEPEPFYFGFDDAGGPNPFHRHPKAAEVVEELGFDLWVMHILLPGGYQTVDQDFHFERLEERGADLDIPGFEDAPDVAATVHLLREADAWAAENDIDWIVNVESANWRDSHVDSRGHDWYQREDGRQFWRFPPDVLEDMANLSRLKGVMFDEPEHMQNVTDPERAERHGIAGLGRPFMYAPEPGHTLEEAADRFTAATREERRAYDDHGLALFSEHIFPVMVHPFARAGYTPAPKLLKEGWTPLHIAMALGSALQYGHDLWLTPDLHGVDDYPSHSPEAYRSALVMGYHMGAVGLYTENIGHDFQDRGVGSLAYFTEDDYRITDHGEVTRAFIHEHVPAHPRPYSFQDVQPRVAIVRQDDGCWGQATSWLPDMLYGNPEWRSTVDTEAWFRVWHLLSRGVIPADGLSWHSASSYVNRPQQVFAPLDGVVVFDHHVEREHLEGVQAIFLTGIGISESGLEAIEAAVEDGAICFAQYHLAPERVRGETGKKGTLEDGAGEWIVTTDFLAPHVRRAVRPFQPERDSMRYRFGETTVTFHPRDGDPNDVTVSVSPSE